MIIYGNYQTNTETFRELYFGNLGLSHFQGRIGTLNVKFDSPKACLHSYLLNQMMDSDQA